MNLSNDLISQFVKATKDNRKIKTESTVYGTTVVYNGKTYVKLDGSDLLTPVSTTTDVQPDERVTVMIKDHTATITGNITSPAARTDDVKELGSKITEVEILVADKVSTKELEAESARIDTLFSENVTIKEKLTASEAEIEELVADNATINGKLAAQEAEITRLDTEKLNADIADITFATIESLDALEIDVHNLEASYGEFKELTTTNFTAVNAEITRLDTEKLSAEQADLRYANIDFTNIGKAAIEYFYAQSGLIKDVVVGDQTITGELVGVTIKGDLIEGGTIKADKLIVKGSDGIYYKLNFETGNFASAEEVPTDSLHGSVITANSITAEKISVKDLVAFDATIGGFHITDTSLYSGVKESVDNTTQGTYLDSYGQIAIGDSNNYIKYFKDTDGKFKLAISAGSIRLGTNNKDIEEAITDVDNKIDSLEIGARNLIRNSTNLIFSEYYFSGTFIASYDGVQDIEITCGASATGDEYVVMRTSATCSDDGAGNVTLK